jgi:hypothetical protein
MSDDKDKKKEKELSKKRREDKIFNNGYKAGEGLREDDEYRYQSSITVNSNYADKYLKDVYEYEETLDYNIGVTKIFELIETDKDLSSMLHKLDSNTKLKLSKDEINWSFSKILTLMESEEYEEQFYNPIYVLEALSSIININSSDQIKDYRKIFDSLDVEIQAQLVEELNKKYGFLEGKMNKRKMH